MDEACAAAMEEDGAEKGAHRGGGASENDVGPPAEDTADWFGVFRCQDCGEVFREEAACSEHRRQHSRGGLHSSDQFDGLHDAGKDDEAANFCTLCSLSFVGPSEFHSHMEESHGQTSPKGSAIRMNAGITKQHTYECPDCGKCYGVIGHLLNHQRSHRQASKSLFHDLEHLKKKAFQCESCGRNYSRASALDAHRRCHEEKLVKPRNKSSGEAEEAIVEAKPAENQTGGAPEKLFKCSCGKAFTALMRLRTHQRFSRNSQCSPEEMKEKPKKGASGEFYCNECNKAFSGHIALFNHQRWHANHSNDSAKRFPCEECGKVFMTLTFYYRHQRMAHSDETPSKSFLHQVCQLQKKAFECKDCGLKFSRASALHSHELHHTDVFRETEKEAQTGASLPPLTPPPPQHKALESERKETCESERTEYEIPAAAGAAEEDFHVAEADDDAEYYEPGDFNVQVISASESDDESVHDPNPDLELLCESDQDAEVSPFSKPGMDLKIVQIDFEQADAACAPVAGGAESKTAEERFDCPECYRWFSSASSLRVHRMWHGIHKRRQQTQGQSVTVYTCDTCGHRASSFAAHSSHIQQHENDNTSNDVALCGPDGSERRSATCGECGKSFSRLSALISHQLRHPKRKPFQCPDCMMSYSYAASLFNHMKNCPAQKRENASASKKRYNPKKTLLGPKIYHCEQCGKGFWSLGAYSHHKQSPNECADLRLRKGVGGSAHPANGHSRSAGKVACPVCGRKFRHRGIMALHMRKHENGNHKCELCSRSFRLFSSLLRHQVVHSDQLLPPPVKSFQHQVEQLKKNTYGCPDCGKLFSRAKALQFHMKSHGYETGRSPSAPRSAVTLEDLQCATCLAHFSNKASLRAHRKLCIKKGGRAAHYWIEPSENGASVKADGMDVGTRGISDRITANSEVDNETDSGRVKVESLENPSTSDLKYKCNMCDRSFSVVGALNFHKRIHAEGHQPAPKANLAVPVMLKKPKNEEPGKGPFHCSECGRRFMSNSALGSHKRWHKEKKFSRPSLKDDDSKAAGHKAEGGPFQCHKCGKQFFNHCVLQRHHMFNPQCQIKTEPEASSPGSAGDSELSSPRCSETAAQGSLEAEHRGNERGIAESRDESLARVDQVLDQPDVSFGESESVITALKPKAHQCPLCSMTFAKARGLRAHKWQVHSKKTKGKNKVCLSAKKQSLTSDGEVRKTEGAPAVDGAGAKAKSDPVAGEPKNVRSESSAVKLVSCLDCGNRFGSAGALLEHKKTCPVVKCEPKQETRTPETAAEVPPPPGLLPEHTARFLYKCALCGKAFQTEEQLETHKTKAESRPYCCALCCHGFWTENQLQQHLAWHDEVRCRLPNEVRYRLGAALASKPLKPDVPSANGEKPLPASAPSQAALDPDGPPQSSHKCQHCGKAFLSPGALRKHETQHCSDDSYRCSVCPRTFSEIQDLIDHHQECIGDYKRPSDAPAAFSSGDTSGLTCLDCGTTFCQETELHQHYLEHARGVC